MTTEDSIQTKEDGVLVKLRISPNASKNQIIIDNDIIKLKVTAQPVENKANKAVVEYLSKLLKVPKTSITIVKGETSKDKTIFIKTAETEKQNSIKEVLLNQNNT